MNKEVCESREQLCRERFVSRKASVAWTVTGVTMLLGVAGTCIGAVVDMGKRVSVNEAKVIMWASRLERIEQKLDRLIEVQHDTGK